jgi:hypothetical protein
MTTTDLDDTLEQRPIEELLADLDFWTGRTKIELVEEAIERWGAIVPHLLAHLEIVIADPEGYLDEDHDLLPYALLLLAHLREERAHPLMLALFSLSGDVLHELLGDIKTTVLPAFLLRTSGGSLDGIRSLVLNRSADEFIRWAAMEALCLAVVAGMAERRETVVFLAGLLTGEEDDDPDSYFWAGVANSLCDLYPDEVMDVVRKAYAEGLIIPGAITLKEFEDTLALGLEDSLAHVRRELDWRVPDDIDKLLAMCEAIDEGSVSLPREVQRNDKKAKVQRKKKKKMAKASRRKNR